MSSTSAGVIHVFDLSSGEYSEWWIVEHTWTLGANLTPFRRSESGEDTEQEIGLVVPFTEKVEYWDDDEASKLLLLPLEVINSEEELEKEDLSSDIDGMVEGR